MSVYHCIHFLSISLSLLSALHMLIRFLLALGYEEKHANLNFDALYHFFLAGACEAASFASKLACLCSRPVLILLLASISFSLITLCDSESSLKPSRRLSRP